MSHLTSAVILVLFVGTVGCGTGPRQGSPVTPPSSSGSGSPGSGSSPSAISISPAGDTLRIAGERQFSGWDSSVGQYDVTWSLQEGAAGGTITTDGLYTAPGTPGTFHLIATSSHDTNLSATASITVVSVGFMSGSEMAAARASHTSNLLADGRVLASGGRNCRRHAQRRIICAEFKQLCANRQHGSRTQRSLCQPAARREGTDCRRRRTKRSPCQNC